MVFLIRLTVVLFVIGIVGAILLWALATFVEPKQTEIVIDIPFEQLGI